MVDAGVGAGVMPQSAARRHALAIPIALIAMCNMWARRAMHVCVRSLRALPGIARDPIELLVEEAREA